MNTVRAVGLFVLASGLVASAAPAAAQSYDGSKPLLCAMMTLWECDGSGGQCDRRPVESKDLPTFVIVDAVKRTLTGMPDERRTEIKSATQVDGRLVLQGGDSGRGWSATIAQSTGKMAIAVVDHDVTFSVFGACTPR
ncbi:MAG: hypothetical protein DMD91_05360 [Candidatus Rokuibacteriota bacterium]|nr:MAG: hypothetical protein DMD91_05360 [Candidatus Rokubacteria bacterium]